MPARPKNATPSAISAGFGVVLEEEDVAERMTRAEHRHVRLVGEGEELRLQLVDLADRLAEIALVDLVGGHGSGHGRPHQLLP